MPPRARKHTHDEYLVVSATAGIGHNSGAKTVFRSEPDDGYTKIANAFLQDQRISYEVRGLVAHLLSMPYDWEITVKWIISQSKAGRDRVYRMIDEAELFGYLAPRAKRTASGKFSGQSYAVTDDPECLLSAEARALYELENSVKHPFPEKPEAAEPFPENTEAAEPFPENTEAAEVVENSQFQRYISPYEPLPGLPLPGLPLTAKPLTANPTQTKEYKVQNYTSRREPDCSCQEFHETSSLDALRDQLCEACGHAIADTSKAPGLLVLSEPLRWLESGCDLERDILPTIRARCVNRKPRSVSSWTLFTNAIADARATRLSPIPEGEARSAPARHNSDRERNRRIDAALAALRQQQIDRGEING